MKQFVEISKHLVLKVEIWCAENIEEKTVLIQKIERTVFYPTSIVLVIVM